jgi:FG-GAP-like repeat
MIQFLMDILNTVRLPLTRVWLAVAAAMLLAVHMVTAQQAPVGGTGGIGPLSRTSVLMPGDIQAGDFLKVNEQSAPEAADAPPAVSGPRFGAASGNLTIDATFDTAITSSANAAAIQNTITTAVALYASKILDPMTVTINFKSMTSGLGRSNYFYCNITYSSFLAALKADSKSADDATATALLPSASTNPVNGSSTINVHTANLRAIGITACGGTPAAPEGTISLNLAITSPGFTGSSGAYSLLSVVEHEIDEVLGLGSALPNPSVLQNGAIFPEDLYRYNGAGARSFSLGGNAFFSINGTTNLAQFHNPATDDGADYGDWESNPLPPGASPKVQDAFATPGANPTLGVELTALDVIGYDTVPNSAPVFTMQPTNQQVLAGQHPQFNVAASGTPAPTYQWQISTNGGGTFANLANGGAYSGALTSTLTVTAAAGLNLYQFRVVAANSLGSVTSNPAVLTVITRPKIMTDTDGDGKGDLTVFRPSSGTWFTLPSSTGFAGGTATGFGLPGDLPVPGDYDGDGKSDLAIYRPGTRTWYLQFSSTGAIVSYVGGIGTDVPVPGDYDGDGRTDLAVYRASTGGWLIFTSSSGYASSSVIQWGLRTDIPVPADYDGDGTTDVAVFRPSNGTWYVRRSSTGGASNLTVQWGLAGDVPAPGDYDGDRIADLAFFRPSNGTWYINQSTTSFTASVLYQWGGLAGDVPAPADYDGDGKTDIAIFRPGTGAWFVKQSTTSFTTFSSYQWGLPGDTATPNLTVARAIAISKRTVANVMRNGDVDGDGRADLTVYRASTGQWFNLRSGTNYATSATSQFGSSGDVPVPSDFDGDGATDLAVFRPSNGTWYILTSGSNFTVTASFQFGAIGDTPVIGDFDGDGRADPAVFRASTGTWYILTSGSNFTASVSFQWGASGDLPVPGDYDGDGATDLAVYRASIGTWFIKLSSTGFVGSASFQWGLGGDIAAPGDFDGDGRTDLGVFRPSTGAWYIRLSTAGFTTSVAYQWGINGDIPVPGDFDGDGKTDIAIWRPSTSTWFILNSRASTSSIAQWGLPSDIPILHRP